MKSINYDFLFYGPIFLVILFFVQKGVEYFNYRELGRYTKYTKGVCYFGLGFLIVLDFLAVNKTDISMYVAAMCFIEGIDLCLEHKAIDHEAIGHNPIKNKPIKPNRPNKV